MAKISKAQEFVNAADKTDKSAMPAPTQFNPRTGKIMNAEDRKKAEEKAARELEKKQKLAAKQEQLAAKKAERERKTLEREQKAIQRAEAKARAAELKDKTVEERNAIADALVAECRTLNIKTPSFRKLVKDQGESFSLGTDGKIQVLDARGSNPITVSAYLEGLGESVVETLRKTVSERKSGWPKREPSTRVKPEDHGVIKLDARQPSIAIDPTAPWASFPSPVGVLMNILDARVSADVAQTESGPVYTGMRLSAKGEDLGKFDREALRYLGRMIGFKVDFVDKLSSNPNLAAEVVNHMISGYRPQLMMFAGDEQRIRDVFPGWREVVSHAEVCQKTWNTVASIYPNANIKSCTMSESGDLDLVITVDLGNGQVSPSEGDYLSAGVKVNHRYGTDIKVGLYLERLVCSNGMVSQTVNYSWTSRETGSAAAQLAYIESESLACLAKFPGIVDNARKMSQTEVHGDAEAAMKERMRQMGVPMKHLAGIVEAFKMEPGNTEWHMLNAITRFATHTMGIGRNLRTALMEGSGMWVEQFDVVKARMPRSIANRVGAEIILED